MLRKACLLLLVIQITGCADLKWGDKWEINEVTEWQSSKENPIHDKNKTTRNNKKDYGDQLIENSVRRAIIEKKHNRLSVYHHSLCNNIPMEVSVYKTHGTQMITLFFLPLFIFKDKPQDFLRVHLEYPNARTMCANATKDMYDISINGIPTDNFVVRPGGLYQKETGINHCYIDIAAITEERDQVEIDFDEKIFECNPPKLVLEEKSFFCIKATKFGGSGYCGN